MLQVLGSSWALMLGMMLLMIGNGIQGTLLGIRGGIEGFSTFEMSIITSAYFAGFLGGGQLTPELIRRVGHVRVFAALASFISAVIILYPLLVHPVAWIFGRLLMGFCFAGVYVTAESWLNNSTDNQNRGQTLSLYVMVQMAGILSAQLILNLADPAGYALFVMASVAVSISFAPILLSITPTPPFDRAKPLALRTLFKVSPLGCVGIFLLGGVVSGQFGMSAVYGTLTGLSVAKLSTFVASFYIGALLLQYPIGLLSDIMDRRKLILCVSAMGGIASLVAFAFGENFEVLLFSAFVIGGLSNPLYPLMIAYTNDFLDADDMPAASGALVFIFGVGAIAGPILTGWIMQAVSAQGFFLVLAILMLAITGYSAYRITQRPNTVSVDDTANYAPILHTASPVVVEVAQEFYVDALNDEADAPEQT